MEMLQTEVLLEKRSFYFEGLDWKLSFTSVKEKLNHVTSLVACLCLSVGG